MRLLFYSKTMNGAGERLQGLIESMVPEENLETYHSLENLSIRLHRPKYDLDIALIVAGDREELYGILEFGALIRDLRIILVLPDHDHTTVSKGHKLAPRFMGYLEDDFKYVAAVLEKMLRRNSSRIQQCSEDLRINQNSEPRTATLKL